MLNVKSRLKSKNVITPWHKLFFLPETKSRYVQKCKAIIQCIVSVIMLVSDNNLDCSQPSVFSYFYLIIHTWKELRETGKPVQNKRLGRVVGGD